MNQFYTSKIENAKEYFDWIREDVITFLQQSLPANTKLTDALEIGCGSGQTGRELKKLFNIENYWGIELTEEASLKAKANIDKVFCGDIEQLIKNNQTKEFEKKYDMILLLDVLEHLYDPWAVLKTIKGWLNPNGVLVCSIPNAGNISVIKKLLTDKFEYESRGLLDITHIRFFTFHTINKMFSDCGYRLTQHTTVNDLNFLKPKIFNILTFGKFKKQFTRLFIVLAQPN